MKLAGANLFLLLLFAGVVGIILGMGMPTTAVYILLADARSRPSIVETGVTKLAAHMFVLYFGMLSMITPPVALAAYAAANISKAGRDGNRLGGVPHRLGRNSSCRSCSCCRRPC